MRTLTALAAALALAGCQMQKPPLNEGPSAWRQSFYTDSFTDKRVSRVYVETAMSSPEKATLIFFSGRTHPQIIPKKRTHFCGNVTGEDGDGDISVRLLIDGKEPDWAMFKNRGYVSKNNRRVTLSRLTRDDLNRISALRVKLYEPVCGNSYVYHFDLGGTTNRPQRKKGN